MNLIPLMGGFFYYATSENNWLETIQPFVPSWLVPDSREAIWKLFEGATQGQTVPWSVWGRPLLAWGLFMVSVDPAESPVLARSAYLASRSTALATSARSTSVLEAGKR